MKLGDVVWQDGISSFSDMVVVNKTEKAITYFRPYASLANFVCKSGVIAYTGIEKFDALIRQDCEENVIDNIFYERP